MEWGILEMWCFAQPYSIHTAMLVRVKHFTDMPGLRQSLPHAHTDMGLDCGTYRLLCVKPLNLRYVGLDQVYTKHILFWIIVQVIIILLATLF